MIGLTEVLSFLGGPLILKLTPKTPSPIFFPTNISPNIGIFEIVLLIVVAGTSVPFKLVNSSFTIGNDAALALYERCGFETYGAEPRALKSTTGYADEVLMVRFLHG